MKKLFLLCNAHLDPVWLWRRNEGLAETISTFRVAAEFCEEFDGFIFNHNEALLYEWVEEHEPELFKRIQKLVADGKWVIMGGWYLQPDCVMTSGESLMEQIRLGHEYFNEKFGVVPKTAINFDPFGHGRGLVQILKNAGYENYVFMRPEKYEGDFVWEGLDGSEVFAHCMHWGYNSRKGRAADKIDHFFKAQSDKDNVICFWGIGNHGGGPSKKDLIDIDKLMKESHVLIKHSTCEDYFDALDKSKLKSVKESLISVHVGCYTSMVRIKQANRSLENKLAVTEKIMTYADALTDFEFDAEELKKAKKALAFCQFHDILPGSAIKPVEDDSLKTFAYGEEIADNLYNKAFFKLCSGQKKAKDGEIPIIVFNPHPYEIEGEFEIGFMLQDQNWNEDEQTYAYVYDEEGREILTQNEKPECTFNLDWIQKIAFRGKLAPSGITRFDCKLKTLNESLTPKQTTDEFIKIENERMKAHISTKTGLIAHYEVDGRVLIENSGKIEVYKDNEDPWGMNVDSFKDFDGEFTLMADKDVNEFTGYPEENYKNVRIVEDGVVRTKIQAFFEYGRSVAVIEYTVPKYGAYIDVDILMYSNDVSKMFKYRLDTKVSGKPYGQIAFGNEELYSDEKECVFHKWCGIKNDDAGLYVLNRGTYGGSFTENSIRLSLLRTPMYATHPIRDRQVAPHDRFIKHIDMGERSFSFRITAEENVEREAQTFNEAPLLLSFFPSGQGEKTGSVIEIDNPDVLLSSIKKKNDAYEAVIYNTTNKPQKAEIRCVRTDEVISCDFKKYEIKTVVLNKI